MKMAYLLIAVGIVCLIAGIVLYLHEPKANANIPEDVVCTEEKKAETPVLPEAQPETQPEVQPETQPEVQPEVQSEVQSNTSNVNNKDENYEKGVEFEKYVVSRFSKKYFSLKEWRGDKQSHGIYAESCTYPDMELTFTLREKTYTFAVECKWRAKYNAQDKVRWSYKDQLARYRQFAKDKNIPVFIILGIGGTPAEPAEVYVVPLASIERVELSRNWLENYRHDLSKNMFFDVPTQTLR